jgi:hypothetical protein
MDTRALASADGPTLFQRLVALATGLAFAGMLASLAAIELGPATRLVLRWHWAELPLAALGLTLGGWFWRLIWRAERAESPAARRRLLRFSLLLGLMAAVSFAYPMRFIPAERRQEVFIGLGVAVLVLSLVGVVLWRIIRMLNEGEPADGECEPRPARRD